MWLGWETISALNNDPLTAHEGQPDGGVEGQDAQDEALAETIDARGWSIKYSHPEAAMTLLAPLTLGDAAGSVS